MNRKCKRKKRAVSILLSVTILLLCLSGCGNRNAEQDTNQTDNSKNINVTEATVSDSSGADAVNTQPAESDGPVAMGRYVEEVTDLSEQISGTFTRLYQLADGTLVITDPKTGFLISKDNGVTWEAEKREWFTRLQNNGTYISSIAVGADSTTAVLCSEQDGEDYKRSLLVIKADGSEISLQMQETGDRLFPIYAAVSESGRVFFSASGSEDLYEVKEDGSYEVFLTPQEGSPQLMQFQGNLLIMEGSNYRAPLIYDMEERKYIEDEVLETFVKDDYNGGNGFNTDDGYDMLFFAEEGNIIYLAGDKGLHRHVLGGSAIEQIIDGRLCTFNNPAYYMQSMVMLPNNEFLTLFNGGKLVHFVYDPDIPTVPNERLYVYSLEKNSTIEQAISAYQTMYPETFVEYEIGIAEGSSITREDALKTLNTKIMAGEGPDVLVLDDMPIDSYIEKGLLLDMNPLLSSLSGDAELFENIVDAMKTGDSIYAMPCEIQIPVIGGEERYISQMNDLKGIADTMEEMRQDKPGEDLLYIGTEKGIMRFFSMVCTPAWMTEDGELDKDAVKEFLEQTKRIYDAQMDGLSEKIIKRYTTMNENWLQYFGELRDDSGYLRTGDSSENYISGSSNLVREALTGRDAYAGIISVNRVAGYEDSVWRTMNGQSSNVFCARTLLGINAASKYSEQAEEFVKLCLGKENQTTMYQGTTYNGFAVNKAAFEDNFVPEPGRYIEESGAYLWLGGADEDGNSIDFVMYWPSDEQKEEIRKCIEAADTPYIENTVLEYAVYDEGIGYFQGRKSLEETMAAIERKVSIYLAE